MNGWQPQEDDQDAVERAGQRADQQRQRQEEIAGNVEDQRQVEDDHARRARRSRRPRGRCRAPGLERPAPSPGSRRTKSPTSGSRMLPALAKRGANSAEQQESRREEEQQRNRCGTRDHRFKPVVREKAGRGVARHGPETLASSTSAGRAGSVRRCPWWRSRKASAGGPAGQTPSPGHRRLQAPSPRPPPGGPAGTRRCTACRSVRPPRSIPERAVSPSLPKITILPRGPFPWRHRPRRAPSSR